MLACYPGKENLLIHCRSRSEVALSQWADRGRQRARPATSALLTNSTANITGMKTVGLDLPDSSGLIGH